MLENGGVQQDPKGRACWTGISRRDETVLAGSKSRWDGQLPDARIMRNDGVQHSSFYRAVTISLAAQVHVASVARRVRQWFKAQHGSVDSDNPSITSSDERLEIPYVLSGTTLVNTQNAGRESTILDALEAVDDAVVEQTSRVEVRVHGMVERGDHRTTACVERFEERVLR